MHPSPRRTLIALSAATVLALVGVVSLPRPADWANMERAIEGMRANAMAERRLREAPYGEARDDFALPHYVDAAAKMRALPDVIDLYRDFLNGALEASDRDTFLVSAATSLEQLKLGAQSRNATPWFTGDRSTLGPGIRLVDTRNLCFAAHLKATVLLEEGRAVEAIHSILDAQQMGADLMTSSKLITEMIGCSLLVTDSLEFLMAGKHFAMLTPESKALWLDGMQRIHETLPVESRAFRGELLSTFMHLRVPIANGSFAWDEMNQHNWKAWRPDWARRKGFARYVNAAIQVADDIDAAYRLPPPEVAPAVGAIMDALDRSLDRQAILAIPDLVEAVTPKMESAASSRVRALTKLADLRHSVALDDRKESTR